MPLFGLEIVWVMAALLALAITFAAILRDVGERRLTWTTPE